MIYIGLNSILIRNLTQVKRSDFEDYIPFINTNREGVMGNNQKLWKNFMISSNKIIDAIKKPSAIWKTNLILSICYLLVIVQTTGIFAAERLKGLIFDRYEKGKEWGTPFSIDPETWDGDFLADKNGKGILISRQVGGRIVVQEYKPDEGFSVPIHLGFGLNEKLIRNEAGT